MSDPAVPAESAAATPSSGAVPPAAVDADEERTTVTIRRAPKFSVFAVVGGLIGFVVTLILTSMFPADPAVGFAASFGYFLLYGVPVGALLGALLALAFDRRSRRRPRQVIAGKLNVLVEPEEQSTAGESTAHSDG